MRTILFYLIFFCLSILLTSCSGGTSATSSGESVSCDELSLDCVEDAITDSDASTTEDISFSSSASDNATVAFGQTYQHEVTTNGTYSGSVTFYLSNEPDGMIINSSSGKIEWTPNKSSDITTHTNITIRIITDSGYIITQTFDLTVTGTCTSGNVLGLWSGDQRTSIDSDDYLGNITAYTDNASDICGSGDNQDCTAENNYYFHDSSVDLTHGPTPTATTGNVFFYNQYDNTTHLYFFYMFGVKGNSVADNINIDFFTDNNTSTDTVIVADDSSGEIGKQSSGCGSSTGCYKARHAYNSANSDGGVIGPFTGSNFKIFVDLDGTSTIDGSTTLTLGNLVSFKYYSNDGTTITLGGEHDNFTVGFKTSVECN